MRRPIYVDIDGTLTDSPDQGGNPIESRLERIRKLALLQEIILWSGGGKEYVQKFAEENNLHGFTMLGKPEFCVDDNPKIRPMWPVRPPEWLDS